MAVTARFAIPYADPSDFVRDLPADMQVQSEAIAARLTFAGVRTAVTDASGFVTFSHGSGLASLAGGIVQPVGLTSGPTNVVKASIAVLNAGSGTTQVRLFRADGTTPVSQSVTFCYIVW